MGQGELDLLVPRRWTIGADRYAPSLKPIRHLRYRPPLPSAAACAAAAGASCRSLTSQRGGGLAGVARRGGGTGRQAVADERNTQEAGAELQGGVQASCSELKARAKPKLQGELEQVLGPASRRAAGAEQEQLHKARLHYFLAHYPRPTSTMLCLLAALGVAPRRAKPKLQGELEQVLGPASRRAAGAEQEQLHDVSAHSLEPHDT
eukprot:CAMPEP_0118846850 /NCGR_PEP_ID=MMETSP1162-20130426/92673_1 /TAXON_ID=33656 /ORGANISM="Phaeocystis Sp, Strain CCMP2710" /LENGTH=205 /DNA_ID=CAMNT_0006779039 /DNA_START=203 /DNA_END=822 /DNA_ORIENTATION=-